MNANKDVFCMLRFFALDKKSRWEICRTLQDRVYLIKQRSWARNRSPLLFVADISLSLFTCSLDLIRPEEGPALPELHALLQAMIDLPQGYGYIWSEHWGDENVRGPGRILWVTVERLSKLCLLNSIHSNTSFSIEEFTDLLVKMLARYREEKALDTSTARSYASYVKSKKRIKKQSRTNK